MSKTHSQAVALLRAQPGASWTILNHLGVPPPPLNQELVGCCLDKRDELEAGKPASKLVLTGAITIQVVSYKDSMVKPGVTTLSKGKKINKMACLFTLNGKKGWDDKRRK